MDSQDECIFCEIIAGDRSSRVLLESKRHICFFDKYPVTEGHALVAPKDHIQYFKQIDGPDIYRFLDNAHKEINQRYSPDGTNIGLNNGSAAGQTIPHLHWHIIPRYKGDIEDPTGGVRGVIPKKRIYTN